MVLVNDPLGRHWDYELSKQTGVRSGVPYPMLTLGLAPVAELYAVPRFERLLWAAEQLEVALFEGLRARRRGAYVRAEPAEPHTQDPARFVGLY